MTITPVTPINNERLVAVDTSIIIDLTVMPSHVDVNGLNIFDGYSFQALWTGSVVNLLGGGKRFSAKPPSDFALGSTIQVYIQDTIGDSLSYRFQIGTERITDTDDTSSPTTAIADTTKYAGYIRDPGVMYVRSVDPISPEVPLISANIVDMGYDPQLNKLIVFFVNNGKVYVTTADPGDLGNSILPPGEANTPTKVVGFPFEDVTASTTGSGGIKSVFASADFPPIKQAPSPDSVTTGVIGSGGIRGIRYGFPRAVVPEIISLDPAIIRIPRPTDLSEAALIVGFYPFKTSNNYTGGSFMPFVSLPPGANYVDVTDPVFTPDAIYSVVCVYRQGNSTGFIRSELGRPSSVRPMGADLINITSAGNGIKNSVVSTTFPPLKQAPPIDGVSTTTTGGGGIRVYFGR